MNYFNKILCVRKNWSIKKCVTTVKSINFFLQLRLAWRKLSFIIDHHNNMHCLLRHRTMMAMAKYTSSLWSTINFAENMNSHGSPLRISSTQTLTPCDFLPVVARALYTIFKVRYAEKFCTLINIITFTLCSALKSFFQ